MIASAAFGAVSAFILDYMGLRAGVSEIFYGLKIWHVKEYPHDSEFPELISQ